MASLATEMPPLHTAEALAGVSTQASTQPPIPGGSAGGGGGSGPPQQQEGIDSTQSPELEQQQNNTSSSLTTSSNTNNNNNTISAAADSSDNQPSTPQPHIPNGNDSQQQQQPPLSQQSQQQPAAHHPYANHHMYSSSQPTTTANSHLNHLYPQQIYSNSNMDMQQQQLQHPLTPSQHSSAYPSYLNSYEQFYQQQQHQQQQNPSQQQQQQQAQQSQNPQMDYINSNSNSNSMYSAAEYKQQSGVRYHPYLNTPISGIPSVNSQNSNSNNALDANSQSAPVVSSATSSVMSPRVVSSTSPSSSSNQMQISGSASSIGSMSAGNPSSPAGTPQCKKCGIMCTNESELQEHIANVHGASPYGSSGYASSPYIKEELQQQQTPPSQSQQQQQHSSQQGSSGNPGEILDLDSQKMLYPPVPGSMPMLHQSLANTDPLHGLHSMQQRAGMATWDQQSNEGLPPYLQQQQPTTESKHLPNHSPYYQSPKQSPYHVTNSTNIIKSEYPLIKSEYPLDQTQYMNDKSFDPTAPNTQQMMPPAVSSSPAEFPSTTTGGPQDSQQQQTACAGNQQFRQGNFEPPSSSSASVTGGPIGAKAANWKSNEARRPKTYNCTACNKWFTSSGHLKRHYNTTLHKNAVKSSGQPDPATLPISVHHHPARDPSGKATRRANAAAAAAAQANAQQQQQQLPPNPVQPPEPPNSPPDYGGPQTAAGGMTPLSHYAATPSPNSMYQQQQQYQQQQHQYMPQVPTTTNASPQHASNMVGLPSTAHHQQQEHQLPLQTQQTVMNGHPNALAGPSVPPTQQQTPMPSSQMRGLLNSTTTTPITMHIKTEHMEAAIMEDLGPHQDQHLTEEEEEVAELGHLSKLTTEQQHRQDLLDRSIISAKEEMESLPGEGEEEDLTEEEGVEEDHREVAHNVVPHPTQLLVRTPSLHNYQLDHYQHQEDMERLYHNTTPSSTHSNMQVHSPLIISHQQYQEQLQQQQQQQQHQIITPDTYTHTQTTPPPPLQQPLPPHHSIMEHRPYINMPPLAINTQQQHNNMLQLQPPLITMEQQPPQPDTTIPTTNMANMLQPSHHMPLQQPPPTELQQLHSTQLPDTNTNIPPMLPSHITTSNITSMPSYHQLQQPASALAPLDHTLTYPHTIIGNTLTNAEVLTLDAYGNLVPAPGQHQQVIQTSDGQFVQLIHTASSGGATIYSTHSYNPYMAQRSPQEGDLPPMSHHYNQEQSTSLTVSPSMAYSPTITSTSNQSEHEYKPSITEDYLNNNYNSEQDSQQDALIQQILNKQEAELQQLKVTKSKQNSTAAANKRKRNPSTSSTNSFHGANSTMLPSGRIKCLPCDKEFTKICYLTQHNKSFHSGEYPFRCQKCGKRYQSEEVYITHLGKHKTTDKAHKCDICPKQFHHKTDLRRHIEAIHTGNKQHICDVCEKSFCRKDHLRKHLETHNRPRVMSKKSLKANNNTIAAALAKAQLKSKDSSINALVKQQPLSPLINSQMSLPKVSETNSLSSIPTSTPSPHLQHIDDMAVDDEDLLEDEMDEYDMEEEPEYITMQEYQEQLQQQQQLQSSGQYTIAKNVYQIIEQELPMY